MIYEVLEDSRNALQFTTHWRARRGRGVLFATSPFVIYLAALGVLFLVATGDLSLWSDVKRAASGGFWIAGLLAALCFFLGWRMEDRLQITPQGVRLVRRSIWGTWTSGDIPRSHIQALALDPSLRSLGADVLMVAVRTDGMRVGLAEGEPHSGQIHELVQKSARVLGLEVEAPKFTQGDAPVSEQLPT